MPMRHRLGPICVLGIPSFALAIVCCLGAATDGNMCLIEKAIVHHMQPAGVVNPPEIDRIAIESGYAIALWTGGEAGGLVELGVPKATAQKLVQDLGMN